MTPEFDDAEGYSFEDFSDFAEMDNYEPEHFLVYRRLVDESWKQAYNIFEEIDETLNSYVPNLDSNSLDRYVSRRSIDREELMESVRDMDRFMDLARYGGMRSEEDYRDLTLENLGEFMKRMNEDDADGPRDMQRVMKRIDEEASTDSENVFDSDEEAFLTGMLIKGFSELRED